MKKIGKIKLNQLSKSTLADREMSSLQGGGNYCAWGSENRDANQSANVCSCQCNSDYYGSTASLNTNASFFKGGWNPM